MSDVLLKVANLTKYYIVKKTPISKKNIIRAVDNVSFEINSGDSFGLIGESGSGKSTLASLILKLTKAQRGSIAFDGIDITNYDDRDMIRLRRDLQVVFQHTKESLDPKMTIEELLKEPLKIYNTVPVDRRDSEVKRLLEMVGIPYKDKSKFPYQISGGQRQRVGIARAISTKPKFIICDEPVSALDVSIQGQILNLLKDLRDELSLTYLFISHDLNVVKYFCNKIGVMHYGKMVEIGDSYNIMNNPTDEYTKFLISAN